MEMLVRDKFLRNKELTERLKQTRDRVLINQYPEATASNLYWGMVKGQGQNHLGRILEEIRTDIRQSVDIEKWLAFNFRLEDEK
jgi:predicted NAD-dependent protein-ADP-ribosyltransferase YbiA (DUF1768 family)